MAIQKKIEIVDKSLIDIKLQAQKLRYRISTDQSIFKSMAHGDIIAFIEVLDSIISQTGKI